MYETLKSTTSVHFTLLRLRTRKGSGAEKLAKRREKNKVWAHNLHPFCLSNWNGVGR